MITARPWRRNGLLVDLPGQIIDAAAIAGLHPVDRCVALLAAVGDGGHLLPRHSFWQLAVTRQARRNGIPLHLIAHEDVLIFAPQPKCVGSAEPTARHGEPRAASGIPGAGDPQDPR